MDVFIRVSWTYSPLPSINIHFNYHLADMTYFFSRNLSIHISPPSQFYTVTFIHPLSNVEKECLHIFATSHIPHNILISSANNHKKYTSLLENYPVFGKMIWEMSQNIRKMFYISTQRFAIIMIYIYYIIY